MIQERFTRITNFGDTTPRRMVSLSYFWDSVHVCQALTDHKMTDGNGNPNINPEADWNDFPPHCLFLQNDGVVEMRQIHAHWTYLALGLIVTRLVSGCAGVPMKLQQPRISARCIYTPSIPHLSREICSLSINPHWK